MVRLEQNAITEIELLCLRRSLKRDGKLTFRVASGSMVPCINAGDMIEVHPIEREIRRFDILVFLSERYLLCHYVWHLNRIPSADSTRTYLTRALSQLDHEELPVPETHILGMVTNFSIPRFLRAMIVAHFALKRIRRLMIRTARD